MVEHYSYDFYREPAFADDYEEDRFGGRFGRYLKERESALFRCYVSSEAATVLDVGTGTGKLAYALSDGRQKCIGVDASVQMIRQALLLRPERADGLEGFLVADAHQLPFRDQAFDAVISSRVLMHVADWRLSLSEMCRVARLSVTFDYPPVVGVPVVEACIRKAISKMGRKVQAYRVFRLAEIRRTLQRHRFNVGRVERSFVLPIALHRRINSPRVSVVTERLLGALGLRRLFGAPVTVHAVRQG